jgi:hypothetical protein
MMGGRAFILLNRGQSGPKSAKQAEIRLAILPKILRVVRFSGLKSLARGAMTCKGRWRGDFRQIWLICHKATLCYLDHTFGTKISAECHKAMPA